MFVRILFTITVLFCFAAAARGQVVFRTVVPQQPITVGQSFQVQYVIEEAADVTNFMAPQFPQFRLVTGPNIYQGTSISFGRQREVRNMVYTLEATKTGKFIVRGAAASIDGKLLRSQDQQVTVITEAEAMLRYERDNGLDADHFLRPGEDPHNKINRNLFMKVMVDRKTCYTGEPVVATFKLYSRLESKSDIVKNPGFYGFSVHDLVNLSDRFVVTENIGGKTFDVHTVRKVELFPLQAGQYTIDPMEIRNTVKFSRSGVYRKAEQEIVEGVNIETSSQPGDNAYVFETEMRTEPVTIDVRPVPVKGRPPGYDGAVGRFNVAVSISDSSLAKNEEGFLELRLTGSGNLIQVNAPGIDWPEGVEGFEPVLISQGGDASAAGKVFRYAFVSSRPGRYEIPSIDFSYFNPDSGNYKTVRTGKLQVEISRENIAVYRGSMELSAEPGKKKRWIWPTVIGLLVTFALIAVFRIAAIRKKKQALPIVIAPPSVDVASLLAPAKRQAQTGGSTFYTALRQGIFEYFREMEGLAGSEMRKDQVAGIMQAKGADTGSISAMITILESCEAGMYTEAVQDTDRKLMVEKVEELLTSLGKNSL